MISTAIAIKEATYQAVHDDSVMDFAAHIYHTRETMSTDEFINAMFKYSAHLSALTATLVSEICLTKEQINEMIDNIKEFKEIEEKVKNGNNE